MRRQRRLAIFASIMMVCMLSASTTTILDTNTTFDWGAIAPSTNIVIIGNTGLTTYPGGLPGSGTLEDPYRIENLVIDAMGVSNGLFLLSTTLHVMIRNCIVKNSGTGSDGILVDHCYNVIINNCSVVGNTNGIRLTSSQDIEIIGNNISANINTGLFLVNSTRCIISGNLIHQNTVNGISITSESWANVISANSFKANGAHYFWDASGQGNTWSLGIIGNFWDNYIERYPLATNDSFNWDMPYVISSVLNQRDEYPLVSFTGIHNPIIIDGNAELDAFPDKSGAGTPVSPYKIEDLKIGAGPNPNCIYIKNTNKFIVLENITASGATQPLYNAGFRLDNCTNINITGCRAVGNADGLYVVQSANISAASNNFTQNLYAGIFLNGVSNSSFEFINASRNTAHGLLFANDPSQNITVLNSTFSYNGQHGAFIKNSWNITVNNNSFSNNNNTGLAFDYAYNVTITSNTFEGNVVCGIDLFTTTTCTTSSNIISGSQIGIYLRSSSQNTLSNNAMLQCSIVMKGDLVNMVGHNITLSNMVGGKPIIYKYNQSNLDSGDFSGAGSVMVINCTNSSMEDLIFSPASIGLQLFYSTNVTIANCTFTDNKYSGLYSEYSTLCTIKDSRFINSNKSIEMRDGADNNSILNNTITNSWAGVFLRNTISNTFDENKLEGCGFVIEGVASQPVYINSHNITRTNKVNQKVLYYYVNKTNLGLANFTNAGQIILINCNNSIIGGCDVSNSTTGVIVDRSNYNNFIQINSSYNIRDGMYLGFYCMYNTITQAVLNNNHGYGLFQYGSDSNYISQSKISGNDQDGVLCAASHNTFANNTITNNRNGIMVSGSNTTITSNTIANNFENGIRIGGTNINTIIGNNISFNSRVGIRLESGSSQNKLYLNIIVGNAFSEAYSMSVSANYWDNNTIGNFWGDYSARYPSATRTGIIWNTPYEINGTPGVYDMHPFYRNSVPVASFTMDCIWSAALINTPIAFTFNGAIGDAPYSAQWYFGDGTTNSTLLNPVHTYFSRQNCTVTMTIRDRNNDISVMRETVYIVLSAEDPDSDGITNGNELLIYHTNPFLQDTDGDDMPDGWEISYSFNPLDPFDGSLDADSDDLTNNLEFILGTDPRNPDSDHDGFSDGVEVIWYTDPMNPKDTPLFRWGTIFGSIAIGIVLIAMVSVKINRKKKTKIDASKRLASPASSSIAEARDTDISIKGESIDLQQRLNEKQNILSRILAPQTRSEMEVTEAQTKSIEVVGKKAKKMKTSSGFEEVIEHKIDEKLEAELNVEVKIEKCIVCNTDLKGTSYVCPFCKTKYCIRCAIALSERHENCWTCKNLLNFD